MSVKKNFVYNVAYQVLVLILPLATAPYLSRVIGAEGVGVYSYTYSVAYYFVMFAMLGLNNYGNREIARTRDNKDSLRTTFWGIWYLQIALAVIATFVYLIYAVMYAEDSLLALIWLPYVISAGLDVNWLFFGLERFKVTVSRNFIVKLLTFILTFILVRGEHALVSYVALMCGSMFVSVAVLWPLVLRDIPIQPVSLRRVMTHLKPNLVLFVPVVAVSLYTVMDKVMLGQLSSLEETGYFESAFRVTSMPFSFIAALGTVMLPRAANLFAQGKDEEAYGYMAPSMWLAMLLSFAFSFGLIAIAPEFPTVFYGAGFEPCISIMTILALDMPFLAWANVIRTQRLIPTGADRAFIVSVVAGAVVNIGTNLLLIPRYGANGAAIGTVAAEVTVCAVQTIAVASDLPMRRWLKDSIPGCAIGLIMLLCVRCAASVVPGGVIGLIMEISIGITVFSGFSLIWFGGTHNQYAELLIIGPVKGALRKMMGRR